MFRLSRVQLQRLFKELDRNGDGVVSAEEVTCLLEGFGVDAKAGELELLIGGKVLGYVDFLFFCETLMKGNNNNDDDGDHEREEIMEGDLRGAFRVFDLDGDGFISSEDLRIALSRLGLRNDDDATEDCRRMIDAYDANSDGFLDFEDFKDMMMMMMMPTVTGQS